MREKYSDATRVKPTRQGRLRLHRRKARIPTANDLVFIKESPDYCHLNSTTGSLGKTERCLTYLELEKILIWSANFQDFMESFLYFKVLNSPANLSKIASNAIN